jgi:hypothetical protein
MCVALGDDEALSPLRGRYDAQHYRLVKFYYECSNLRYLTSLITVPKLPQEPPNLLSEDDNAPALPTRPRNEKPEEPAPIPREALVDPEPINEFWKDNQKRQQEEYEAEQRRLQQQWEQAQQQQQQQALQAQRDFEEQQRLQAEQARLAQEQLMREQYQQQTQGRLAELERENLNARAQYERDQLMLQQYDQRMKALEGEIAQMNQNFQQQMGSRDDQLRALQEQLNTWRSKYESLAKLYSQLRHEHLQLLQKFKAVQLKANSAQEAIDGRDKLQRELKSKNLELADMIRERDRALMEKDRHTGGHREELEKLKRELRAALDRADNAERGKGSELSAMLNRHNREIADLEEALRNKTRALDEFQMKYREGDSDLERQLRDKEEELEIFRAGMDQTLLELNELKLNANANDNVLDGHLDTLIQDSFQKINDIIDSVLQSGVQRVDDALYELDSSMQAGNQNATGPFVLSQIEKASTCTMEFSTAFNNLIADGPNAKHADVINAVNSFSGSIVDVLVNTKGLTRFASDDNKADQLINAARASATSTIRFFRNVQSVRLYDLDAEQKINVVINNSTEVVRNLQSLSKLADAFAPKSKITNATGDLGDLVDNELTKAANAIDAATERLSKLMKKPRDQYSTYELKIHDSILEAAIAVTNAIAQLIKAATASQQEIVREGRGSMSKTQFYKKHNRWTEGLISAAKAVATSTNMLIETADGVISGRNSPEQLIVASNDVAASTAQLVAASRVKASFMSKTQDRLESASKTVTGACRALVRQVQEIIAQKNRDEGEVVDYSKLGDHEFKVRQMEQQVSHDFCPRSQKESILMNMSRLKSCNLRTPLPKPGQGWAKCASCLIWKTKNLHEQTSFSIVNKVGGTCARWAIFAREAPDIFQRPKIEVNLFLALTYHFNTILHFVPDQTLTTGRCLNKPTSALLVTCMMELPILPLACPQFPYHTILTPILAPITTHSRYISLIYPFPSIYHELLFSQPPLISSNPNSLSHVQSTYLKVLPLVLFNQVRVVLSSRSSEVYALR